MTIESVYGVVLLYQPAEGPQLDVDYVKHAAGGGLCGPPIKWLGSVNMSLDELFKARTSNLPVCTGLLHTSFEHGAARATAVLASKQDITDLVVSLAGSRVRAGTIKVFDNVLAKLSGDGTSTEYSLCAVDHKHRFSEPVGLDWRCRFCGASMDTRGPCRRGPFCRGGPRYPKACEHERARVVHSCQTD